MTNIVTLDEVRAHLRYTPADTIDDNALLLHIAAADEVMRKECGDNVPTQYVETYDGGELSVYLIHSPVLSVENVEEGWGWIDWELDYIQVNTPPGLISMFAYSLDTPETGKVSRRTAGNINIPFFPGQSNIKIVYTAGRNPVPPVIRLAELELIAHWWQNSQQRASAASTANSFDAMNQDFPRTGVYTPINQGVPWRILEMIKPYRSMPIIG